MGKVAGGPSEAAIRLALAKDEAEEAATGGAKLHGSSVTSFLKAGMQLEDTQRRIRAHIKGHTLLAAEQNVKLAEMHIGFFSRLAKFRKLQAIYMQERRREALPTVWAANSGHSAGVPEGLAEMEGKLREGQCRDALVTLRSRLHAKRHLLDYRGSSVAGQRAATRAYTLIGRIGDRVDTVAVKYRRARLALIALRGESAGTTFRELTVKDIQLDEEREIDANVRTVRLTTGSLF
ncbi:hypothetical protein B0H13DRAFT_2379087 [Mycena leptocephala]|nr:hypothetical protein B0H13DRAFT_2379087 [Mycena leptocephala]